MAIAFALHALNEVSKAVTPAPGATVLTIAKADGTRLGQFTADGWPAVLPTRPGMRLAMALDNGYLYG
ncbi:hypothetical protein ACTWP5_06035 [Streptomyces sp. 4N509B]|uniref:hypothetical protein n=1 Tax=Streptomyces sp. 4N509B TaxID=3457413 RepID=UPI003FCEECD6